MSLYIYRAMDIIYVFIVYYLREVRYADIVVWVDYLSIPISIYGAMDVNTVDYLARFVRISISTELCI